MSFVKLNDTNVNYNLSNIETDLALPRPYTNFLKRSFKCSGAMLRNNLSCEAKTAQSLSDFKHTCLFAFHAFYWIALILFNILFILNAYISYFIVM